MHVNVELFKSVRQGNRKLKCHPLLITEIDTKLLADMI